MIELDRLTKEFGPYRAVDGISFSVGKGEVLGFLGPNGAGKSTTMRMITGFLTPTSGAARVNGKDVQTHPMAVKRSLGYLPEGAPAWPDMTPKGLLSFAAEVRGFGGREATRRIGEAAEKANLDDVMLQPIGTLSKGFKRRVGLAHALLHDPPVLIMDEPTDGLDPNQKHEVRKLISAMAGEKAIVISTHILEEVEAICTRAIVIAKGKLVADETPQGLEGRSDRHNGVSVAIADGAADKAAVMIDELPSVAWVDRVSETRLFCRPVGQEPIAPAVAKVLRDNAIGIDELYVERGKLDEVFRQITQGAEPVMESHSA